MVVEEHEVTGRSFAALRMTEWGPGTTEWGPGMAEWVLPDEFVSVHNNNRNLMSGKG